MGAIWAAGTRSNNRFSSPYAEACTCNEPKAGRKMHTNASTAIATPTSGQATSLRATSAYVDKLAKRNPTSPAVASGATIRKALSEYGLSQKMASVPRPHNAHAARVNTNCALRPWLAKVGAMPWGTRARATQAARATHSGAENEGRIKRAMRSLF